MVYWHRAPTSRSGMVIRLRPLKDWHLVRRLSFCKDPELAKTMGVREYGPGITVADLREWRDQAVAAGDVILGIEAGDRYIGDIHIGFPRGIQAAELNLMIGDRSYWGRGIGSEVVRRVLRWLLRGDDLMVETSSAPPGWLAKDRSPAPLGHVPGGLVDFVDVTVAPADEPARSFWLGHGFRHHSTERDGSTRLRLYRDEWLPEERPCTT